MVTVVLVMMVLTSLSVAAMQIAQHDTSQSSYDRKRDLAIQSAEQRMDEVLSLLPTTSRTNLCSFINTGPTSVAANWSAVANTRTPIRTYTAIDLYTASGKKVGCTATTDSPNLAPKQMILNVSAAAGTAGVSTRAMQTKVLLSPRSAKALYGSTAVSVTGNSQITGASSTDYDADVYSDGSVTVDNPRAVIAGSVYSQGSISIKAQCIAGDVAALNSLVDATQTGKDCVSGTPLPGMGDITSSTSSVNMTGGSATGVCSAGTTVTGGALCAGGSVANNPSAAPPTIDFPKITYSVTDWCGPDLTSTDPCGNPLPKDYSIKVFTGGAGNANCINAQNWVFGTGAGQYGSAGTPDHDYLVRIDGSCGRFTNPNNSTVTLKGNLAIFADDGFNFSQQNNWLTKAGSCNTDTDQYPGSRCGLFIIEPYQIGLNCAGRGISLGNNTDMRQINLFAYSQCNIDAANMSYTINGQFLSGATASISNNGGLSYIPLVVPAIVETGYDPSPVYFREVVPS